MELLSGVTKEDYSDYILYFIETLSDELKEEIRNRLVAICYGHRSSSVNKKNLFLQSYGRRIHQKVQNK